MKVHIVTLILCALVTSKVAEAQNSTQFQWPVGDGQEPDNTSITGFRIDQDFNVPRTFTNTEGIVVTEYHDGLDINGIPPAGEDGNYDCGIPVVATADGDVAETRSGSVQYFV